VGEHPGAGRVVRVGRRPQAAEVIVEVRLSEEPEVHQTTVDAPIPGEAVGRTYEGADPGVEDRSIDLLAGAVPAAPAKIDRVVERLLLQIWEHHRLSAPGPPIGADADEGVGD